MLKGEPQDNGLVGENLFSGGFRPPLLDDDDEDDLPTNPKMRETSGSSTFDDTLCDNLGTNGHSSVIVV
jgi:hypothetical protein